MDCFLVIKLLSSGSREGASLKRDLFIKIKFSYHLWNLSHFVEIRIHILAIAPLAGISLLALICAYFDLMSMSEMCAE